MAGEAETPATGRAGKDEVARELVELRVRAAGAIRRRREMAGMNQEDFAARLGVTPSYLARIENGRGVSLDRLMNAFFASGARVNDLVEVSPGAPPGTPGTPGA